MSRILFWSFIRLARLLVTFIESLYSCVSSLKKRAKASGLILEVWNSWNLVLNSCRFNLTSFEDGSERRYDFIFLFCELYVIYIFEIKIKVFFESIVYCFIADFRYIWEQRCWILPLLVSEKGVCWKIYLYLWIINTLYTPFVVCTVLELLVHS